MKKSDIRLTKTLSTLLVLATILLAQLPLNSFGQVRTDKDDRRNDTISKNGLQSSFNVWTELNQRDLGTILPDRADAQIAGRNGFLVSGITDHIKFAVDLALLSGKRGVPAPRFSLEGQPDPGKVSPELHDLGIALGEALAANFQNANNFPGGNWPAGVFRDPTEMWSMLRGTGYQKDPFVFPPNPVGKGKWVKVCKPTGPCDPPGEPPLEDVDQCIDEKREIKRVQRWLDAYDNAIKKAEVLLDIWERAKWANDSIDKVLKITTIAVISLGPAGALTGFAFAGGALAIDYLKGLLVDRGIDATIAFIKSDLGKLRQRRALFQLAMDEARAALEACLKKAAETEAANAAAWDNYFNVDLPAYYKCLDARRCYWEWVPE